MPALEALDRYTILGRHGQTTYSTAASGGPHLSDIEYFRGYNRPRHARLLSVKPQSSLAGAISLSGLAFVLTLCS